MHRHHDPCAEDLERPTGVLWVHVLVFEEPLRIVGTDRKQGPVDLREPLGDRLEHGGLKGRISTVVRAPVGSLVDVAAPKGVVDVERATRGPMVRWYERDPQSAVGVSLPPVQLNYVFDARSPEDLADAERRDERGIIAPRKRP